jgi:hypothetical protein
LLKHSRHGAGNCRSAKIAAGIGALYEGTRRATMRRFGETDDKTQEVI